jgi:predicted dienelactone hydrolase
MNSERSEIPLKGVLATRAARALEPHAPHRSRKVWPIHGIGQTRRPGSRIVMRNQGMIPESPPLQVVPMFTTPLCLQALARRLAAAALAGLTATAGASSLGQTTLPPGACPGCDPVTVYYPTAAAEQPVARGRLHLLLAPQAAPERGNGRLVVISHGSGGSPWVHADLARALVQAGFTVAMPAHLGDNHLDDGQPGPESWKRRPQEMSRAIDAMAHDPQFAPLLQLDRVGLYGMSAGGHTALTLAGGRWSPSAFRDHCDADLAADFASCVGLITRLTGGWADGLKLTVARAEIRNRFSDPTWYSHTDPRIAAIVAGVPSSADFDFSSLARPVVPLALITAGQDRWLKPAFHSDQVLQACAPCELLAALPQAGHGALLSPLPPGLTGRVGELLNDPPGFDRSQMAEVDRRIVGYFQRHLLP